MGIVQGSIADLSVDEAVGDAASSAAVAYTSVAPVAGSYCMMRRIEQCLGQGSFAAAWRSELEVPCLVDSLGSVEGTWASPLVPDPDADALVALPLKRGYERSNAVSPGIGLKSGLAADSQG